MQTRNHLSSWILIKRTIIIVGLGLSFLAFVEVLHVYEVLRSAHVYLGNAFLGIIGIGILWILWSIFKPWWGTQRILNPPKNIDYNNPTFKDVKNQRKFTVQYLTRLSKNSLLDKDAQISAELTAKELTKSSNDFSSPIESMIKLHTRIEEIISPMFLTLDNKAEEEISTRIGRIMIWVSLSPYKAADIFLVLYHNISMINSIIKIYNSRPTFQEQVRIFKDVLNIIAYINIINASGKVLEGIASGIPGFGRLTDDIAQGVGAGYLTSIAGHMAIRRCRTYFLWDKVEEKRRLTENLGNFYNDVKGLVRKKLIPELQRRGVEKFAKLKAKLLDALDSAGKEVKATQDSLFDKIKSTTTIQSNRMRSGISNTFFFVSKPFVWSAKKSWNLIQSAGNNIKRKRKQNS